MSTIDLTNLVRGGAAVSRVATQASPTVLREATAQIGGQVLKFAAVTVAANTLLSTAVSSFGKWQGSSFSTDSAQYANIISELQSKGVYAYYSLEAGKAVIHVYDQPKAGDSIAGFSLVTPDTVEKAAEAVAAPVAYPGAAPVLSAASDEAKNGVEPKSATNITQEG
jgi:hypothetical protein